MSKKYYNRELSWIKFNGRVLEESCNLDNPLLERGKFLSICASNLDEFFMVRIGGLVRNVDAGATKVDAAGMTAQEQLAAILPQVQAQVARQYLLLNAEYMPALNQAGIHLLSVKELSSDQKSWLSEYFDTQVSPLLTPRAIDDKRPFPLLAAKCLHVALLLPPAVKTGAPRMALIPLPTKLPRITMLPTGKGRARGVLLEDVITLFAGRLFGGATPIAAMPFRLTRNTDFVYDDSDVDALIVEMRKNLKKRKWGKVVRLEVPKGSDNRLFTRIKIYLDVASEFVFQVDGPLNLDFFMKQLSSLPDCDDLRFPAFTPYVNPALQENKPVFDAIREGDILLNHPYDSFDPVVRLIDEAADDPDVMAIKQTLYRVSGKSPIVAALSRAAQQGKQVTVLIEVRARFDEENNINWCLALEKAGCHVFYGVPNLKCHSKITLIVRKEENTLRRYVHLATGNYNDSTAKLYTDFGLLTCNEAIGRDASAFFNSITGFEEMPMEELIVSPTMLRKKLNQLIRREKENALDGKPARIVAKMNSLVDPKIIAKLYKAADAGVQIDLIVRGICCARVKGHENLRIRSIVGRFLEHSRAFVFYNNGEPEVFLSSADWMPRNLDKRVEIMFPVLDPFLRDRVIASLEDELHDNRKAWQMKKNGEYRRVKRTLPPLNSQETRILGHAKLNEDFFNDAREEE